MCHTYNTGEKAFRNVYNRYPETLKELESFNAAQAKPITSRKITITRDFEYSIYPRIAGSVYVNDVYLGGFNAPHFINYNLSALAMVVGRMFNVTVKPVLKEIQTTLDANGYLLQKIDDFEFMIGKK